MSAPDDFVIEVDELEDVVGDLEACERQLAQLVQDLERQMATLHGTWDGLAATAQHEAHEEWSRGMTAMHAALADLRAAARLAHDHYTGAAATNVTMWRQVT
jgi:WXG100 family type VII secretion target